MGALSRAIVFLFCAVCLLAAASTAAARAPTGSYKAVCGQHVRPGFMHCDALVLTGRSGARSSSATLGLGPADLQAAYGLSGAAATKGADQTIAIVDAYGSPRAESDLAVYRAHFHLPACTSANGCFRKVDQHGGTGYPASDPSWAQEVALDLDMASAMCPHCRLMLVEAASSSASDLATATDTAARLGATQISNSYGGDEFPSETSYEPYYRHPGVAVVASSGDNGYGVEYPAASAYVSAVGGTTLRRDAGSPDGWSETAWSGAGSGCSAFIAKPSWQSDGGCSTRAVADVSAVADPTTGVASYDGHGWGVFGGTSAATPVVAGAFALLGPGTGADYGAFAYQNRGLFHDVTSGSNGSCGIFYLCSAGVGFDGPTGVGTPWGGQARSAAAPAAKRPSVRIARGAVRATRRGTLTLRLTCPAGSACSGHLVLRAKLHGRANVTISKRGFYVAPGRTATLRVRLSKRVRALLGKTRRLRVNAAAHTADTAHSSAAETLVVRAPRR